jgi:hypothetical protein
MVNSGSWVFDETKKDRKDCDTFVYIDTAGICLMRWVYEDTGKGRIECLCREKVMEKDTPPVDISLCDYIAKTRLDLSLKR